MYKKTKQHKDNISKNLKNKLITDDKVMKTRIKKGQHLGVGTEFKKGDIPWNKGKKNIYKKESIDKMSKSHIGQKTGKDNPNWKGGISTGRNKVHLTQEYRQWRKSVFERDNYTCVICGEVGGRINAHHIKLYKDYPKLRLDINNGITLCQECHRIKHKRLF